MQIKASNWVLHPEGHFQGKIISIQKTVSQSDTILNFTVETTNLNGQGPTRSLSYQIPYILGIKSRLGKFHQAIMGQEIETNGKTNVEKLIGRRGLLTVEQIIKDNGRKGNRISEWSKFCKKLDKN